MKALMNWIEKYLAPAGVKLSENRYLASIRDGLAYVMPFLIIGSMVLVVLNLPIKGWGELAVIKAIRPYGVYIWNGTMGVVALLAAVGIGGSLASKYKIDPSIGGVMAAAALIVVTPEVKGAWGLPFHTAGWLFTAMVVSILSVEIAQFFFKRKLVIKLPDGVPPAVGKSFAALLPGLAVMIVWSLVEAHHC